MTLHSLTGRNLALRVLDLPRLRELAEQLAVSVSDRRSRDAHTSALAERGKIHDLVGRLSRDELKAMCRALGFPDDGREKAAIAARLLPEVAPPELEAETALAKLSAKPWRTRILDLLQRDELVEGVDELELEAGDRRELQNLRDAIDKSPFPVSRVVDNLPRTRLKEICRVLGLDDSGREKMPLVERICREKTGFEEAADDSDDDDAIESSSHGYSPNVLSQLLTGALTIEEAGAFWPATGSLLLAGTAVPVDIHARIIGGTGRNPLERRFQNPATGPAIISIPGRPCLLFGIWLEQGIKRAVLVAFDAYRRVGKTTRTSLFMQLSLLENAADTGFVAHETTSGEVIYAFRPEQIARYMDAFSRNATWQANATAAVKDAKTRRISTSIPAVTPPEKKDMVEIRPKAAMFAAFARLNYKPWFALAELVDNAVQSFLTHRGALTPDGAAAPLVVDIQLDDDELLVTDRAAGIALKDFHRAFSPATPPPDATGLSEFGLGMKAACSWFSREWSVRTSALGEPVERTIAFDVDRIASEGLEHLPIEAREARAEDHYTVISMRRLRVRPKGSTLAKVKDHLASIYRLLIADGSLRVRFTANGKSEELAYEQPKLLTAPFYRTPKGKSIEWRAPIDVRLDDNRVVTGWAGILESGKYSRAGFSVFRRKRLIEGSVGEAYRHRAIFGAPNSFASQRIVGELYVHGFEVSHTKDGIQWGDEEDSLAYAIRLQLDTEEMPLLDQADGYRAKKTAASLPHSFGSAALGSTVAAIERVEVIAPRAPGGDTWRPPPPHSTFQQRRFALKIAGEDPWDVEVELVRDPGAEWLHCGSVTKDGRDVLEIRVNLDHPFSEEHINDNERALEPLLRLAIAISLGEKQARIQGVKNSGSVRRNANELLRLALAGVALTAT